MKIFKLIFIIILSISSITTLSCSIYLSNIFGEKYFYNDENTSNNINRPNIDLEINENLNILFENQKFNKRKFEEIFNSKFLYVNKHINAKEWKNINYYYNEKENEVLIRYKNNNFYYKIN